VTLRQFVGEYVVQGEPRVRGGKQSLFFVVSDQANAHARHGLVWDERSGVRVAVYAHGDAPLLIALAESLRPKD